MKKPPSKISLGDIAREAGISRAAVSYVMRNKPGVAKATREKILKLARKRGYAPDARLASWMSNLRGVASKELLPIAWLNTNAEKDAWQKYKFLSPYLEGARERAFQLGYRLQEIWGYSPEKSMRNVSQQLYRCGIEGVIVTHPARHFLLKWEHLAAVSMEGNMFVPGLHRVMSDYYANLLLALKVVRRSGYRRIGVCLDDMVDRQWSHACSAAIQYFQSDLPKAECVPPLFYEWGRLESQKRGEQQSIAWIKKHRPDVVVGMSCHLVKWTEAAGFRVPQDIGVVHIASDDDVADWAGVCSHRREIGAAAAQLVISLMQNRQFGIPKVAHNTFIRGVWRPGRTLLNPKPQKKLK